MKREEFIKQAIENGYGNGRDGKKWLENNLSELDYIFQSKEYKDCEGYNNLCMSILLKEIKCDDLGTKILSWAWYSNNNRENKIKKNEKVEKFAEEGFEIIKNDEKLNRRKIEFIIDSTGELFGDINKYKGRLVWSPTDKMLMAMKGRCTRKGYWINNKNIYVKFIN